MLSLLFVADYATALDTCFGLLKFGGAGHTAVIYAKNDTRIREYGMRMPAMRVLVNTPAPQGSTGITTNVFPSMTLGCGAMAGNSTSDNVGPLHLINIKRLAYTVRTPEEAFEMPLDYDKAEYGSTAAIVNGGGAVDRAAVVSAVERYLASRGIAVSPPAASTASAPSCGCSTPAPQQSSVQQSVVASVAAEVVDRFLARRGTQPAGSQSGLQKSGGYS